MAYQKIIERT